jgi:release factor glutamine methyltransferase
MHQKPRNSDVAGLFVFYRFVIRRILRYTWLPLYRHWALRYVQLTRIWNYRGLKISVPPGVFHPGIYFSTPIFLDFLSRQSLTGQRVLDVGTGSGAIALWAARLGAAVTAVDLNSLAVDTARQNAALNGLSLSVYHSDLLTALPEQQFDYLLVNPPYYPRSANNTTELAFFAGEQLEYFVRFFTETAPFCHENTIIWMILSEDCDWNTIAAAAQKEHYSAAQVWHKRHWGERLFVAEMRLVTC